VSQQKGGDILKVTKDKRITFRAPEAMRKALEETAQRLGCDVSQVLRHLVKQQVVDKRLTSKEAGLWE
jgi:hypothetical protein